MAYDENPDAIDDILLTLEDSEKIRLPTLTLYTGERLIPSADPNKPPRPPVNLHLSLGGSYSSSSSTTTTSTGQHENYSINSTPDVPAAVNNILNASVMMKRSYLEQNNHEMPGGHEEEIILIDDNMNAAGGGGGGYYNKQKYSNIDEKDIHTAPPDIDWAARSASGNRALRRALHIIKSESSSITSTTHQKRTTSTRTHDDRPHPYQGAGAVVAWQQPADVVFQELEPAAGITNSMNPDDFLSISPMSNNCAVNVDVNTFKETSSSTFSRNPENILFHTATYDKGKSSVPAAPPIPNYYYYYGTRGNGNLITSNFSGIRNNSRRNIIAPINSYNNIPQGELESRKSGPGPRPPPTALLPSNSYPPALMPMAPCCSLKENAMIMHYHETYMTAAAVNGNNTQPLPPAAFAFGSNQWSNVPMSSGRFPAGHPLMKRNEYLRDSQIDMIRHMPTVTTDGGIPNGRRIEGFLYRYSKYEDVIIVCFCHGSFFSPKEFVMHAAGGGGGTTATATDQFQNPMRLITIVPHD